MQEIHIFIVPKPPDVIHLFGLLNPMNRAKLSTFDVGLPLAVTKKSLFLILSFKTFSACWFYNFFRIIKA